MANTGDVSISIDYKEWEALFAVMRGRFNNIIKLLQSAYATLGYKDIIQHFEDESSPWGKWKPLKYRKGKPLQDTGNLRKSITPSNWRAISSSGIVVFANAPYGQTHDEGTAKIPQRKFMWISDKVQTKMAEYLSHMIVDGRPE